MRPFSLSPLSTQHDTSPDASTVKTLTPTAGTSGLLITVETTNARVTFDGSTPSATNGHVFPKDQPPWYVPVSSDARVKWISTASADCIVQVSSLA